MAQLIVGPLLRYTGSTQATVWVETDAACEVEVLDHRMRTFHVEGHHYALVVIDDLEPDSVTPYTVRLDGEQAWPPGGDDRPPAAIHTRNHERQARLVFGSCRVGAPQRPPWTLTASEHPDGLEVDALWAFSRRLQSGREPWPDCLLLLGDQVYADEVSPETLAFARERRDIEQPPGAQVADFEEYARLYRETWTDPDIRWLLATVPSTMIFDDHDVHDDWNISESWVREMREKPWWEPRIVGAFMAYWIYQHLGNLAPPELAEDPLTQQVAAAEDAGPLLREFGHLADRESAASRWAYHRDFGRSRLVVVDSRAARVLADGQRDMVDAEEWDWIVDHARGDFDHLIIASTLPVFMLPAIHHVEAWNEAVCAGAWSRFAVPIGERIRRGVDLEHWPAFGRSFATMIDLLRELAAPRVDGTPPATITIIGGDVHTAYVAEVDLGRESVSRVYQVVCSPFRHPLTPRERRSVKLLHTRVVERLMQLAARAAGVRGTGATWRVVRGPTFDNSIAVLTLDERAAHVTISRSGGEDEDGPALAELHTRALSGSD